MAEICRLSNFTGDLEPVPLDYSDLLPVIREEYGISDALAEELWIDCYFQPFRTMSAEPANLSGARVFVIGDDGLICAERDSGDYVLIDSLSVSPLLFAQTVLFWAAALYLAVYIVILAVRALKKADRRKLATVLLIIVLSCGISFFYTLQSYRQLENEYRSRLNAQCGQLEDIILSHYGDIIDATAEQGVPAYCAEPGNLDRITQIEDEVIRFLRLNGKETCFSMGVDVIHDDVLYGLIYPDVCDETGSGQYTYEEAQEVYPGLESGEISAIMADGFDYITVIRLLRDSGGRTAGVLYMAFSETHLRSTQRENGLNMLISLLVIMIAFYTLQSTFKKLGESVKDYRTKLRGDGKLRKLPVFCAAAAFLCTVICQFDSVVLVYAAQSLSEGLSPLQAAKYAALPVSLYSFGLMSGSTVANFSVRKLGERGATVASCALGIAALLAAAFSLKTGSLPLFTAAKCVEGLTVAGITYSIIYSAPFALEDKEEQRRLYTDCQTASSSAGLLGVLAGGYISEYLSYSVIFSVKAVLTLALGFICFAMFERGKGAYSGAEKSEKPGGAWSFFLKPQVLFL